MRHPSLTVAVMRGLVAMADATEEQSAWISEEDRRRMTRVDRRRLADIERAVKWINAKATAQHADSEQRQERRAVEAMSIEAN